MKVAGGSYAWLRPEPGDMGAWGEVQEPLFPLVSDMRSACWSPPSARIWRLPQSPFSPRLALKTPEPYSCAAIVYRERELTHTQAAAPGSKVAFVGMGTANLYLPTGPSLLREVDLFGVFRYANTYPDAIALLASGQLGDVGQMISQRYPLERANEAFEDMKRGKDKDGKTVIKPFVGNWDLK